MAQAIRVVVADDSPTTRRYLTTLLNEIPDMQVIGEARNGQEAVLLVERLKPDVVSMDVKMPEVDGLEATRQIMTRYPTPVVIASEYVESEPELSGEAFKAGAVAVVGTPPARQSPAFDPMHKRWVQALKAMSSVKVISRRRYPFGEAERGALSSGKEGVKHTSIRPEVVAIGASTGGPRALQYLLSQLPSDFPLPILIVQHMPSEFIGGLIRWLQAESQLPVQIAAHNTPLHSGGVWIAPGRAHLKLVRRNGKLVIQLDATRGVHRHHPSINALFDSVALTCGVRSIGVVLTGMGDDGADGLLNMQRTGATTLVQDEASSTVFGMPRAAVERGATDQIISLTNMPSELLKLV